MVKKKIKFESNGNQFSSNIATIKAAIDYLNKIKNQLKLINEEAAEAFHFIYVMTARYISTNPELIDIYEEINLINVVYNVIDYLSSICFTLKAPSDQNCSSLDQRKFEILYKSIQILNFLTINSVKSSLIYFQLGGAKSLLNLLDNNKFTKTFKNDEIINRIVSNVNWLSKTTESLKTEWADFRAVDIILKVAKKYPSTKLIAYTTFANIATDKHIDTLTEVNDVIKEMIVIIDYAADCISKGNVTREYQPFKESDDQKTNNYEVYVVPIDKYKIRFTLTGILLVLNRLAVNNTIRSDIYLIFNLKEPLKKIITSGSLIEKRYALHVLAQLCFDHEVLEELTKDVELCSVLEEMVNTENSPILAVQKLCEHIMWCIKIKNSIPDISLYQKTSNQPVKVVISYNIQSKELCLRIKKELENRGFEVVIDISNGSSINEMAKCVETCDYFLMCVTEKYRQSVHCQAEAQYSFKMRKKIIPLIMQKGYSNVNGWLGALMYDKNSINFIKKTFEQSMYDLIKELDVKISSYIQRGENSTQCIRFQANLKSDNHERNTSQNSHHIYVRGRLTPQLKSNRNRTEPMRRIHSQINHIHTESLTKLENKKAELNFNHSSFHDMRFETKKKPIKFIKFNTNSDYKLTFFPKNWNEQRTDEWFNEKNVPNEIKNILRPYDGDVLYQLYKLRKSAPEFFYQSIASKGNIDLPAVLLFTYNLENLFENYFKKIKPVFK